MKTKPLQPSDYQILTEALLSDKGLAHLSETACRIFRRPVFVVDSSYQILSKAFPEEPVSEPVPSGTFLQASYEPDQNFLDKVSTDALKKARFPEELNRKTGLIRLTVGPLSEVLLAAAIRIKSTPVASVLLPEAGRPLTEAEEALFLTFRDLLCQELQKSQIYQRNRDEYTSYLLVDLLNNKYPDEETIRRRLSTLDFEPEHHMCVVVLRKRVEEDPLPSMEMVLNQVRGIFSGHLYAVVEHAVVILFHFKEHKKLDETMLGSLQQICENNDLIAGISNDFRELSELTRQYRLATRAALVCQRYVEDHRIIFYDDVFDLALLEYCDRHNNLMDFVHSSIQNLYDYDRQYGTNYLYTFWVYTENACNTGATAAKMFLHKNTLAYRITKIREILGSDLTSGKDLFAFQLSMRILRMLGKLEK